MREPNGRAAAQRYLDRQATDRYTRKYVTGRLMHGASPDLQRAVDLYTRGIPAQTRTEQQLLQTIDALTDDIVHHQNPWHLHRGRELINYLDWAHRKALQIKDPA